MNLRQMVEGQYGMKVVELLDQYAEIGAQASLDYDIGRHDRRALYDGQQLAIKQQLIDLKGPIVTHRIHVSSTGAYEKLSAQIDTFYDVDEALKEFRHNLNVSLDSESSECFIYSSAEMAPKLIAVLEARFPGLGWIANPQSLDMCYTRIANSWPDAKEWLRMKYAKDE